jgi:HPr kinase/phosphorylase
MTETCIHANCVVRFGRGVLIRGASGSGKSSLALALIRDGWMLVADDYVQLHARGDAVIASAPAQLRGLIEVYYHGVIRHPARLSCAVSLLVDLVDAKIDRMPAMDTATLLGKSLQRLTLPEKHSNNALCVSEALRGTAL